MTEIDPYEMENNKEEKLNQFNSMSNSNNRLSTNNNQNVNNFRSLRSLKNNLNTNNNLNIDLNNNNLNNNIIEQNANNLIQEMRVLNPYVDINQNIYPNNQFNNQYNDYEENQGMDNNNFVQNLSEYNLSQYNSIRPLDKKNNNLPAPNQFAKTIVHLDDEENKKKISQMKYSNEENLNVNNYNNNFNYNVNNQNNRKFNLAQKSNAYENNDLVMFFFINPESGTQTGLNILNMGVKKVEFNDPHGMVFIYNMKDPANLEIGIQCLLTEFEKGMVSKFYYIYYNMIFLMLQYHICLLNPKFNSLNIS